MSDSSSSSSSSSGTATAIGATLAIVLSLVAGALLFVYIRRRRVSAKAASEPENAGRHSLVLDRMHPASRVTPWSPDRAALRFTHNPGEAMRVAHRREDGGWEFSEPLNIRPVTFTPELGSSMCLSPTSSVATSTILRKDKKIPGELTTRGYVELDGEGLPPPAYSPR